MSEEQIQGLLQDLGGELGHLSSLERPLTKEEEKHRKKLQFRKYVLDRIKEAKDKKVSLEDIARVAWVDLANLPDEVEAGLFAHYVYRPDFKLPTDDQRGNFSFTYSYAVTAAVVEVDVETGKIKILRMACVDDAGERLNPLIVEGQIYGAIGHQLGAALYERLIYDENGQLVTSSFKDYCAPTALDFPSIYLSGGQRGLNLSLSPSDLVVLTEAKCAAISTD